VSQLVTRATVTVTHALMYRPGASEALLDAVEAELGVKLCPSLRVLYRVHDGQELEFDRQVRRPAPSTQQLRGGAGGRGWQAGRRTGQASMHITTLPTALLLTTMACFHFITGSQVDKQRTAMHESVFHGMFGGGREAQHVCCVPKDCWPGQRLPAAVSLAARLCCLHWSSPHLKAPWHHLRSCCCSLLCAVPPPLSLLPSLLSFPRVLPPLAAVQATRSTTTWFLRACCLFAAWCAGPAQPTPSWVSRPATSASSSQPLTSECPQDRQELIASYLQTCCLAAACLGFSDCCCSCWRSGLSVIGHDRPFITLSALETLAASSAHSCT
jgi:hypothetical protein